MPSPRALDNSSRSRSSQAMPPLASGAVNPSRTRALAVRSNSRSTTASLPRAKGAGWLCRRRAVHRRPARSSPRSPWWQAHRDRGVRPVRLLRAVFLHYCPAPQAAGRSGIAPEIVKHPAAPGDPGDVIRKVKDCPHRIAVSFKASIGVTRQRRCRLSGDPIESAAPLDLF